MYPLKLAGARLYVESCVLIGAASNVGVIAPGIPCIAVGIASLCGVSSAYKPVVPVPARTAEILPPLRVFRDMPTDNVPDVTADTLRTVIGLNVLLPGNATRGIMINCGDACVTRGATTNRLKSTRYHENPSVDLKYELGSVRRCQVLLSLSQ